jgi:hypothetical protein
MVIQRRFPSGGFPCFFLLFLIGRFKLIKRQLPQSGLIAIQLRGPIEVIAGEDEVALFLVVYSQIATHLHVISENNSAWPFLGQNGVIFFISETSAKDSPIGVQDIYVYKDREIKRLTHMDA